MPVPEADGIGAEIIIGFDARFKYCRGRIDVEEQM
jgi:hypothetical protein